MSKTHKLTATEPIEWRCDACGVPIGDDDGHITVDHLKAMRNMYAHEDLRDNPPDGTPEGLWAGDRIKQLFEIETQTPWNAYHRKCDQDPSGGERTWWLGVERIRTVADVLQWNDHLADKNWLPYTDWTRFIWSRVTPSTRKES